MTPGDGDKDARKAKRDEDAAVRETDSHPVPPPVIPGKTALDETVVVETTGQDAAPVERVAPDATQLIPAPPPGSRSGAPPAAPAAEPSTPAGPAAPEAARPALDATQIAPAAPPVPGGGPPRGAGPKAPGTGADPEATQLSPIAPPIAPPRVSQERVADPAATLPSRPVSGASGEPDLGETSYVDPMATGASPRAASASPPTAPAPQRDSPPTTPPVAGAPRAANEATVFAPGGAAETMVGAAPAVEQTIAVGGVTIAEMELERVQPPVFRGEALPLDRGHRRYRIGRSERCDIRLYTASASREHADLEIGADGFWYVTPLTGKQAQIDGQDLLDQGVPVRLEPGQVLLLGEDELRMRVAGEAEGGVDRMRLLILGGVGLGLVSILAGLWLFLSG